MHKPLVSYVIHENPEEAAAEDDESKPYGQTAFVSELPSSHSFARPFPPQFASSGPTQLPLAALRARENGKKISTACSSLRIWVRETLCSCRVFPQQYVLWKAFVDAALMIIWLPSALIRSASVHRHLCPPVWTEGRCDEFVRGSYRWPLAAFLLCSAALVLVYTALYHYVGQLQPLFSSVFHRTSSSAQQALARSRSASDVPVSSPTVLYIEAKHKTFSYFVVFLWLHVYLCAGLIIYTWSLRILWLVPFALIACFVDFWMLSRIMPLRHASFSDFGDRS